ncbi:hypothetical protein QE152_g12860 [Popillia japonica]|uniref:Uncharacterized protein n=1 Tax=Popillia japonica TaxID=7064 RepID=A0AAW1LDM3_POPJA
MVLEYSSKSLRLYLHRSLPVKNVLATNIASLSHIQRMQHVFFGLYAAAHEMIMSQTSKATRRLESSFLRDRLVVFDEIVGISEDRSFKSLSRTAWIELLKESI